MKLDLMLFGILATERRPQKKNHHARDDGKLLAKRLAMILLVRCQVVTLLHGDFERTTETNGIIGTDAIVRVGVKIREFRAEVHNNQMYQVVGKVVAGPCPGCETDLDQILAIMTIRFFLFCKYSFCVFIWGASDEPHIAGWRL